MIFEFSGYRVDTESLELLGPSGPIPLQPQAFALLTYLIENAGRVVSKDEIFDTVWQGRVVGDATLHSRINALRRALGDDGTSQAVIKTLPRQGFRFLSEVQTIGIPANESHQWPAEQAPEPLAATGPVVAVLPFKNLSGDPEQAYFADGIAEDILTALGRFGWIVVIARSSSFSYRANVPDVRQLNTELGAGYVVDGSVRKIGDRVRVSVELVDASSGRQLFSERYDRVLDDIFSLQDEIVHQVAVAIAPTIEHAEINKISGKAPDNLAAWEACLRASALVHKMTLDDILEARRLFSRAIELDPSYSRAHSGRALTYSIGLRFLNEPDRMRGLRDFYDEASLAVELDPLDSKARILKALAYMYQAPSDSDLAIGEAKEAVSLNPHDPQAQSVLGVALALSADRYEEGLEWIMKAVQLSNRDALHHLYLSQLAIAYLCAGRYEASVKAAQDGVHQMDSFIESHVALASALGSMGENSKAKSAIGPFSEIATSFVQDHLVYSDAVKLKVLNGLRGIVPN